MWRFWVDHWVWTAYCVLGPLAWLGVGFVLFKGRKRMTLLGRADHGPPAPPPRVSIVIPAKDEGQRIRACIASALAQDYPNFEVLCVNDRSKDETGRVMDEMAAASPNMSVVHIRDGELPAGWTGKNNALATAVRSAGGDWLLFVDSDVVLAPTALSSALAFCAAKRVGLFSLLPRLESHTLWESLVVPLAGCGVSMMYVVALTNNDHWPGSFANGQFLLFDRRTYEAIGGHAAVRNRFCEDVEFARLVKDQLLERSREDETAPPGRVRVSWGADFAAVRMYDSLPSILRGWARIFYACSVGRPWRIVLGMAFLLVNCYSAYAAIAWGAWRGDAHWLGAGAIHLGVMSTVLAVMYSWSGNPRRNALLFPLGGAMLAAIFAKALRMCFTHELTWRGTRYTAAHSSSP